LLVRQSKIVADEGEERKNDLPVDVIDEVDQHQDGQHLPLLPAEVRKFHLVARRNDSVVITHKLESCQATKSDISLTLSKDLSCHAVDIWFESAGEAT
jgi:hypothetical protein